MFWPLLSSSENYERWMRHGAEDAAARASKIWREKIAAHGRPALDGAIRDELSVFVAKRGSELGD